MIGVRGKLFAVSLLLIAIVGGATTLLLEGQLRDLLQTRIEGEMLRHARTSRTAIDLAEPEGLAGMKRMDALADALGESSGARITVIDQDGAVVGDSKLSLTEMGALENHATRPEVQAAMRGDHGVASRFSSTLQRPMLYAAVPVKRGERRIAVVRAAIPLQGVDDALWSLRRALAVAGGLGLLIAIFMSGFASTLMASTLRQLVDNARAVARGDRTIRISHTSSDELGNLAGSFNVLSEGLDEALDKLATERDRLGTILESMGDAVLALDDAGQITLANGAAHKLLELEQDPIGRSLIEVIRAPALAELVERASGVEAGDQVSAEVSLPAPLTSQVLAIAAPVERTGGMVLVMHDVTEMRRLEMIRRDFVANVSHELRTPISIIRASAETLLDGGFEDAERGPEFVHAIDRNAERLKNLISDLLDLAKIEAGGYSLALTGLDVEAAARNAVESLGERAAKVTITCDEGLHVLADRAALGQIFVNLVDNALKYGSAAGAQVRIRRIDDDVVRIEVEDDGPGIRPQHRERIFERFYRADPGRSRAVGGTGLGLAICRHLAEVMGGRIGFEPREPNGSCFWLTLPVGEPDEVRLAS